MIKTHAETCHGGEGDLGMRGEAIIWDGEVIKRGFLIMVKPHEIGAYTCIEG
jgi:hypothetical protein